MALPNMQKTVRKQEGISEKIKNTRLKIKDLIIPIIVSMILLFISIFVFIPMLKEAFNYRTELKEIKSKQEQLIKLKQSIESISEDQLNDDLIEVKSVIPRTLKVASFLYYIDELARLKNLTSDKISASDVNIGIVDKNKQQDSNQYKGVNGPLAYRGSLENILNFLDNFYYSSPYIVSPQNISLTKSAELWEVELSLTGYYVSEEENLVVNIYKPFKPYTDFADVMEILKEKSKKLNAPVK
ncbi:MAG TPA: hypothetical protein P5098_00025 [Candidatus Dojkabacteria bacterium]|jgi:hypothetical protein|uniref:Uncharacterized protein n=1 Tax=Candidatus Dojkabacteria bacterium TaxID=2099670 RepID=A0A847D0K4_9BACT|nr:hypothetical protein [Candidatus Dojkabacteria bacterium]HRY74067.1 hypothetical protein [Candidatus Dojkabacteria bacterium]HRZ84851.1 hypothetical protein [Candidatus Dojkabacteria bacterium]